MRNSLWMSAFLTLIALTALSPGESAAVNCSAQTMNQSTIYPNWTCTDDNSGSWNGKARSWSWCNGQSGCTEVPNPQTVSECDYVYANGLTGSPTQCPASTCENYNSSCVAAPVVSIPASVDEFLAQSQPVAGPQSAGPAITAAMISLAAPSVVTFTPATCTKRGSAIAGTFNAATDTPARTSSQFRVVVFENTSGKDIWIGGYGKAWYSHSGAITGEMTGFCLPNGYWDYLQVPADLKSGNFWPRTGCGYMTGTGSTDFDNKFRCQVGDCYDATLYNTANPEQCNGKGPGNGVLKTEITTGQTKVTDTPGSGQSAADFYDLSAVDGISNVAVKIDIITKNGTTVKVNNNSLAADFNCNGWNSTTQPAVSGRPITCVDFNLKYECPPELQYKNPINGDILGCYSIGKAASQVYSPTWFIGAGITATNALLGDTALKCISDLNDPNTNNVSARNPYCSASGGKNFYDSLYGLMALSYTVCQPVNPNGTDSTCATAGSLSACSPLNPYSSTEVGGKCYVENWPRPSASWCRDIAGITNADDCRYDKIFKRKCPDAYSWQYDDHKSTFQCNGPDYFIQFSALAPTSMTPAIDYAGFAILVILISIAMVIAGRGRLTEN